MPLSTNDALVRVENMSFSRGSRKIFSNINLSIAKGKVTAVMGPSGTGKTTLLRLMGAELFPDKGKIFVNGDDIHQLNRSDLYKARQGIGLLFQSGALFTDLNVFENVAFPLREHADLSASMLRDIVFMKLEAVGLRGAHALMASELSGGMARRVALARTIALDPKLILYDEPFAGQDPISMGVLIRLLKNLNELMAITSVVVSHDVPETLSIADYAYIISNGKIIGEGTPDELRQSDDPFVIQFLQGKADGAVPFHYPGISYREDLLNDA
tara:strand:+ start:74 stop:886 length:813 start_codon:yes stop_codon:yes gene_type:complete